MITEGRNAEKMRLRVSASIGVAEWKSGESVQQLLERADHEMYTDKMRPKSSASGEQSSRIALVGRYALAASLQFVSTQPENSCYRASSPMTPVWCRLALFH